MSQKVTLNEYVSKSFNGGWFGVVMSFVILISAITLGFALIVSSNGYSETKVYVGSKVVTAQEYNQLLETQFQYGPLVEGPSFDINTVNDNGTLVIDYVINSKIPIQGFGEPQSNQGNTLVTLIFGILFIAVFGGLMGLVVNCLSDRKLD